MSLTGLEAKIQCPERLRSFLNAFRAHRASQGPHDNVVLSPEADAWNLALASYRNLNKDLIGAESFTRAILTAAIAPRNDAIVNHGEHVLAIGGPGSGKTFIARKMLNSLLDGINADERDRGIRKFAEGIAELSAEERDHLLEELKKVAPSQKVFSLQTNVTMPEGVATGFQVLEALLQGKDVINTETSITHDSVPYLLLDEFEKANPAFQSALAGILQERQAFHGNKVVQAFLRTAVATSNENIRGILENAGEHRPTIEAILDRFGVVIAWPAILRQEDRMRLMERNLRPKSPSSETPIPTQEVSNIVRKVQIPDSVLRDMAYIFDMMDQSVTASFDHRTEASTKLEADYGNEQRSTDYIPRSQASNRTLLKNLNLIKASFIAEQIAAGVPFDKIRTTMSRADLHHLAAGSIYAGPGHIVRAPFVIDNLKPRFEVKVGGVKLEQSSLVFDPVLNRGYVMGSKPSNTHNFSSRYEFSYDESGIHFDDTSVSAEGFNPVTFKSEVEAHKAKGILFEDDGHLAKVVEEGRAMTNEDRCLIDGCIRERQELLDSINARLATPEDSSLPKKSDQHQLDKDLQRANEELASAQKEAPSEKNKYKIAVLETRRFYLELMKAYPGNEAYVRAIMRGLVSDTHVFAEGPPGGAKTAIARTILQLELKKINQELVEQSGAGSVGKMDADFKKLFFLQLHKMVSSGKITGFEDLHARMKTGANEVNNETSLTNPDFIFGLLDEVHNSNYAVMQVLLNMLNEREAFLGHRVAETLLRSVVMTSNKMPFEIVQNAPKAMKGTVNAFFARVMGEVYVPNKFLDPEQSYRLLRDTERGINRDVTQFHPPNLTALQGLGQRVIFENNHEKGYFFGKDATQRGNPTGPVSDPVRDIKVLDLADAIASDLVTKMRARSEASLRDHRSNPGEFPYTYQPRFGLAPRDISAYSNFWRSSHILDQVLDGKSIDDINFIITVKDVADLAKVYVPQGPWKVVADYNEHTIFFRAESQLDDFINSPKIDPRQKARYMQMKQDLEDFLTSANTVIPDWIVQHKASAAQYPSLFPSPNRDKAVKAP